MIFIVLHGIIIIVVDERSLATLLLTKREKSELEECCKIWAVTKSAKN
jgi:hypothetical protein